MLDKLLSLLSKILHKTVYIELELALEPNLLQKIKSVSPKSCLS